VLAQTAGGGSAYLLAAGLCLVTLAAAQFTLLSQRPLPAKGSA
jgi:hypothetical protein